ncbi:MAG: chemotaxis protein CheA [Sphingomonadaceae bacterium]
MRQLRLFHPAVAAAAAAPAALAAAAPAFGAVDPTWLARLPAATTAQCAALLAEGATLFWLRYSPAADCFFQGLDPLHLANQTPGLLWGAILAPAAWPPLAELDAYRCTLQYELLSCAPQAELAAHFRYVSEAISWFQQGPVANTSAPATPAAVVPDATIGVLLDAQRRVLAPSDDGAGLAGRLRSVMATLSSCLQARGAGAAQPSLELAGAAALAAGSGQPLLDWMGAHFADGSLAVEADSASEVLAAKRSDDMAAAKTVRVDQHKIDRLMNLIGEIVVAKNAMPYLAERAEREHGLRELARDIKGQYAVINRISEDMQDAIMQVRMMPVSFVFQRFPRLVRDLSQRLGKQVRLVMEGEDTAADKNIIEALGDPLVHMVRNCLDHGLETPAQRLAAGKPAHGTLTIVARQQSDRVLIEISDDGRGIVPELIKRKALEQGLADQASLERLSEHELVNLVFAPGFSTAEAISDLSGRGVGMDVVRTAVERINGSIVLDSVAGQGTRIRLSLPLSMAVSHVMTVESNGQLFGVAMDMVVETVRLPARAVRHIKTSMTAVLRERVIPLRSLNQWLQIASPQQRNADDELAVLVVRNGDEQLGIIIDEFHQTADIILKPLPGVLAHLPAYAGSALMGDGTVLMVLNLREMMI